MTENKPLVVIKCDRTLNTENLETWQTRLAEQYKSGVILIPNFCHVEAISGDNYCFAELTEED